MIIKLGNLNQILNSMSILLQKELPIKTSYKFSKLNKKLIEEYQTFEENRKKLIQQYGFKDENGEIVIIDNIVQFEQNNQELFIEEFEELLNIECDIVFEPIKINELENLIISPIDLMVLEDFIIE